jgi:RNA polymerase sigma factor (sigma-70 family)
MKLEKKLSDEELVKLFISTQKNSYFEVIYDRYADKIYRKCYSFLRDSAKSEDFMHDIFLKLILNLSSYKENSKFSTYIYSITYNYCIDHIRQAKKMQEVELEGDFEEEDSSWAETKEMDAQKLNKALDSISTEEKTVILMKYQDDLSISEISEALKISESAVKMRLKRTKEKVRNFYLTNIIFWSILISKLIILFKLK